MNSLSIGWTQAVAVSRISRHRRIFGLALFLQLIIGGFFLFAPTFSLNVVNMSPSMGPEWPSVWGATLIFVTVLQIPGAIDPINHRYVNVIAVFGRLLMVITFVSHGGHFLVFALFDLIFGALIYWGFRRAVIAELQSRP